MIGAWLAAIAILLILPSNERGLFDGLPLSSEPEFIAFAALIPFLVGRGLREELAELIGRVPRALWVALAVTPFVLIVVKVVLMAAAEPGGFEGCYRSLDKPRPGGRCEESYENTFRRGDRATRIDEAIDFGPWGADVESLYLTTWNLSFLNDNRFNETQQQNPQLYRLRHPIAVDWRGPVEVDRGETVRVRYVGTGTISLDGRATQLPAAYGERREVTLRAEGDVRELRVAFRFTEPAATRENPAGRPYAEIQVDRVSSGGAEPLEATSAGSTVAAARVVDAGTVLLVLILLAGAAYALRDLVPRRLPTRASPVLAGLPGGSQLAKVTTAASSIAVLVVTVLTKPKHPLLLGYIGLLAVSAGRVLPDLDTWDGVSYRTPGNDPLTYESHARAILDHRSLEGGESIFYYQPAFRYIVFLNHVIWGDADTAIAIMALTAMGLGVLALAYGAGLLELTGRARLATGLAAALVLVLVATPSVDVAAEAGLSEYPTWILVPLVIAVVVKRPAARLPWILAAVAIGLTITLRSNQAVGGLILLAALIAAYPRPRARLAAVMVAAVVATCALVPLHNLVYGDKVVVSPRSLKVNQVVKVGDMPRVFSDSEIRDQLKEQADAILMTPGMPDRPQGWPAYWALLALWLATVGVALFRRARVTLPGWLLLALPLAYLLPYLGYQVAVYYPRHVTMGYIAMGCASVAVLARVLRPREDEPAQPAAG